MSKKDAARRKKRKNKQAKRRRAFLDKIIFENSGIRPGENAYGELCRFIDDGEIIFQEFKDNVDKMGLNKEEKDHYVRAVIAEQLRGTIIQHINNAYSDGLGEDEKAFIEYNRRRMSNQPPDGTNLGTTIEGDRVPTDETI
jgi:hypothetical protein